MRTDGTSSDLVNLRVAFYAINARRLPLAHLFTRWSDLLTGASSDYERFSLLQAGIRAGLRASGKLKPGALSLYVGMVNRSYLCFLFDGDGFINRFVDNTIQVSRNNMGYFSSIPRDGTFEIDLSNSLTNESSIYAVSNKIAKLDLDSALLWHCRLGHISKKCIEKLQHDGLLDSSDLRAFEKCVSWRVYELRVLDHLNDHGIIAHRTPHYTSQHNGVSERRNITLLDMVRSMMSQTTLPKYFWDYALETAAHILNMVPTKKGCEALVKRDTLTKPDKLEPRSIKCIFVGYPKKMMGYSFYYPLENKVLVAQNAKFLENSLINQEASGSPKDLEIIQKEDTHPSIDTSLNHKEDDLEIDEPQSDIVPIRRSTRTRHAPDRMCLYIDAEEHESGDLGEPTNYKVVLLDPESEKRLNVMNVKMQSMKDNEVWVLVELPPKGKTVGSKWLFKKKTDMDGNVRIYKAHIRAIRILIATAAYYDYEIWQMDVKTAFLNGYVNEEKSAKQSIFATSSAEAEYIAAFHASKEAVWVKKFISGLGVVPTIEEPISMYYDNTGAIAIANESGITKGARHFRAKVHYLREVIEFSDIKLEKVHTDDNLADPFTKALAFPKHSKHTRNIGMLPASSLMSMFEISGNNFNDWFRQHKLVLRVERKLFVIEQPISLASPTDSKYLCSGMWYMIHNEVACLMLGSKGKDKQVYIPKPKNPKPSAKEHPAKDGTCHHCEEVGHYKRNCLAYLAELIKKKNQVGTASSLVSKNDVLYFNVVARNGIYEIDMHDLVPNVNSIIIHASRQGASYFITFTDDYSRYGYVYLLRHKHEKIPMVVEGFEPPQEEVILIHRSERTHRALDCLCLNVEVGEHSLGDLREPTNYKACMLDPESKRWVDDMNAEMQSMMDNMVWVLVDLPPNSRLVAKGYTQTCTVDYEETFSPVAGIRVIRILISITAFYDYEIWKMDVKISFLNGYLDEDRLKVFFDPKHPRKVCKLQRSIYGLKQVSRSWNKRFDEEIKKFGFYQNLDEPCVYQKASGSNVTFLILYVDDIIIMGNHIPSLQSVKNYLEKCFSVKDLGKAAFILGIKIYRDRSKRLIGLGQNAYMDKVLKRYKMDNSKRGYIPMQERLDLNKTQGASTPREVKRMQNVPYASVIGSIMYAVRCTRPDVAFA
uniref:Retrotransposon protein, putative, Ty1-copia subclass n=1 Tax=Tanacetum cinerariifolium TaxID=118510 RepID=A0A6L2L3F9_TANCI|nr:retrotransposon protein, putative, Ty1-copia subclass [Tanacetum cinerariifolium]